jgi:hypothetical protein
VDEIIILHAPRRQHDGFKNIIFGFWFAGKKVALENDVAQKICRRGWFVETGIFTPAQMKQIIGEVNDDLKPLLAVGAFCGLRSEELNRLDWRDVRLAEGVIIVGADKAKTSTRRVVPIPENCRAWLAPHTKPEGQINPAPHAGALIDRIERAALRLKIKWVKNGLRHSFCSYRLALTSDPARVATEAEHYAGFCMRNSGKMSPTLFLIGADGVDADEKDAFANTARLVCIAHAATVSVMVLETWMKTATPGENMDMTEPPSESFDRQEVIVLMGESLAGLKQKFLPIIRHDNGKIFNLGETTVPGMDKMEGRFAQILPPKVADDQMRLLAKTMLKVKGVNVAKPVGAVRLPRSRR